MSDTDYSNTLVVEASTKRGLWEMWCPRCKFTFERTKKAIANSWADQHNVDKHDGELTVIKA